MKNNQLSDNFFYRNDKLFCDEHSLSGIAKSYGTPLFVYSESTIENNLKNMRSEIINKPVDLCYAVKANPSLSLIKIISSLDCGFDVVSGGELRRVLSAAAKLKPKIVFSGVGKTIDELDFALSCGISCINVESISELKKLNERAKVAHLKAPISIRINPDIDPKTHPYISTGLRENKFGLSISAGYEAYKLADKLENLKVIGVDCHIGSQIIEISPFIDATEKVLEFVSNLEDLNISIDEINLGGGLGICYKSEHPPTAKHFFSTILNKVELWAHCKNKKTPRITFEFGRSIVGNSGLLICKVIHLKETDFGKNFAIVDAAMNDILRPSLYNAYHEVFPLEKREGKQIKSWDIVGPICESGDWLAKDRLLHIEEGALLAFASAGAYCSSMSSNYNSRVKSSEVLVRTAGDVVEIKKRENFHDLINGEYLLDY